MQLLHAPLEPTAAFFKIARSSVTHASSHFRQANSAAASVRRSNPRNPGLSISQAALATCRGSCDESPVHGQALRQTGLYAARGPQPALEFRREDFPLSHTGPPEDISPPVEVTAKSRPSQKN